MAGARRTVRKWLATLETDIAQIRCRLQRLGRQVEQFTVQLEIELGGEWRPVVRYDNAHGFCHRDTIHADGTQDKTPVFVGDLNETVTYAIDDLRANWESYRGRFLEEMRG